jgi:diguanylate cyclase (GGDEF)-like protein
VERIKTYIVIQKATTPSLAAGFYSARKVFLRTAANPIEFRRRAHDPPLHKTQMSAPLSTLRQQEQALQQAWSAYRACPNFERFVAFSSQINHLTDILTKASQTGLLYVSRQLEQKTLALFGDERSHPIPSADMASLGKQVTRLGDLMRYYANKGNNFQKERREKEEEKKVTVAHYQVCLMGEERAHRELVSQLGYFGIAAQWNGWILPPTDKTDLSIYLVDVSNAIRQELVEFLKALRDRQPLARIVCMNVPDDFISIHQFLQAGVDHCLGNHTALQRILELVLERNNDLGQKSYRVLVVEDSPTAIYMIRNSLEAHGVTVDDLRDPSMVLQSIRQFQPDLILMDMYMPYCTGVEAAQVIRQHDEFLSIPIVYLSGETNVGLQVAALRLGGDQFLNKPYNPVLMNAIVKSKIDRYRALRHSMQNDSLTGLLNHISSKQALTSAMKNLPREQCLVIAMLDIDHFKNVNDTHGHQVGDQVIRSLAWLLRQRLRQGDIAGRYGGEEFVLGLSGKSVEGAIDALDRIREDFRRISFVGANGRNFTVSFSAGVASYAAGAQTHLEALLKAADDALYQAKQRGRNRIALA